MSESSNVASFDPGPFDLRLAGDTTADVVLNLLAKFTDTGALSDLPVTLEVGGSIYSGELVSRTRWFELLAEQAARDDRGTAKLVDSLRATFIQVDVELQMAADQELPLSSHSYLHLAEAVLINGGRSGPRGLWRIRASEVSAWTIGSYRLNQ